jgi:hypothetical protein
MANKKSFWKSLDAAVTGLFREIGLINQQKPSQFVSYRAKSGRRQGYYSVGGQGNPEISKGDVRNLINQSVSVSGRTELVFQITGDLETPYPDHGLQHTTLSVRVGKMDAERILARSRNPQDFINRISESYLGVTWKSVDELAIPDLPTPGEHSPGYQYHPRGSSQALVRKVPGENRLAPRVPPTNPDVQPDVKAEGQPNVDEGEV